MALAAFAMPTVRGSFLASAAARASLAENPAVSEETIRALAGRVSRKMLERYNHILPRRNRQPSKASKLLFLMKDPHKILHNLWTAQMSSAL